MAWRGPMVSQALQQLFSQTAWNDLDYLIVDMPPGTGDIQLTMSQKIPVSGAVIVTTPQDLALMDARKGLVMFEKTNIPVLGIVENMALHVCSNCGHEEAIFGAGGAQAMSKDYHVPLLGQLPLAMAIREMRMRASRASRLIRTAFMATLCRHRAKSRSGAGASSERFDA